MEAILSLSLSADWSPVVGELVENFGQIARVLEVRADGNLIVREVGGKMKWMASPEKCRPVR